MSTISIALADVSIRLDNKRVLYNWIKDVIASEKKLCGDIGIILCSDEYLLDINKKFLNHEYYTDIITFDYTEGRVISGELYISLERVKENAAKYKDNTKTELSRVMVHGILHLCGYKDKGELNQKEMRRKENEKLRMLG